MVAVLVTHNPGDWFSEALAGLAAQDYPQLAVLCVNTGAPDEADELDARVREVLPDAALVHAPEVTGYGDAANRVRGLVEGAGFYCFVHDDVALEGDAIRVLVEEAFRSNAAIAGPKLLDWNDPQRIVSVGSTIDSVGSLTPYAEPGELDQEQHDRVRDCFVVSGGAMLVRADLFETIDGFDSAISFLGDDLDLCWRAQLAGARVVVVPDAVGRHVEALHQRQPADKRRRLVYRHRLHSMAKCYGWVHLLGVLPLALLLGLAEMLYSLLFGRFAHARDVGAAWGWNLVRLPRILKARRRIKRHRRVRDRDLARLQTRGSARLNSFLRGQIGGDTRLQILADRGRRFSGTFASGPRRTALIGWLLISLALAFGTRHLITRGIPVYGQFAEFPGTGSTWHGFWSGWRDTGLGSSGPGPAGLGLVGLFGSFGLGAVGLLRQVMILGLLPLGLIGMWRLVGPLDSRRARLVAVVLYASIPLPYNALAGGRWDTLLLYGTLPFVVFRLNRLIGVSPYGSAGGEPGPGIVERSLRHQVVSLGLFLAVIAAFEPLVVALVPALALVLVVASIVTGSAALPLRAVGLSLVASLVASILHFPWWVMFGDADEMLTQLLGRPSDVAPVELYRLLRFESGPWGGHLLGWAPLVVSAVPLLVSRGPRAAWSVRAWGLGLAGFGGAWVAANGWLDDVLGRELAVAEMLLVPAAVGIGWAAAIGFASFEVDVPRFAFGWRQLAMGVSFVALAAAVTPALLATTDGRWRTPTSDLRSSLSLIDDRGSGPSYRVMWIGAPEVLPLDGWEVADGLLVATSVRGFPDLRQQWSGPLDDNQRLLVETVQLALEGDTSRLGRLLAPMGVKYVVVVERGTPSFSRGIERRLPLTLAAALKSQLDLRPVATDPSVLVFENDAYFASRAQFEGEMPEVQGLDDPAELVVTDLTSGIPVLTDRRSSTEQRGRLAAAPVLVAETFDEGWSLSVDGLPVEPSEAFGWSMRFEPTTAGDATLSFDRSLSVTAMLAAQAALWLVALRVALAEQGRLAKLRKRRKGTEQ